MTSAETVIVQLLAAIAWAVIALSVRGWERLLYRSIAALSIGLVGVQQLLEGFS